MKTNKTVAMVVHKRPHTQVVQQSMNHALHSLARAAGNAVTPATVAPMYGLIAEWVEALEATKELLRSRIIDILEKDGEVVTDKGARSAELNGWHFEMRPQKTGPDSKKVEALLRAKGLSPAEWMDTDLKYKASTEKLAKAVGAGVLSEAEAQTCNYDLHYAVISPKKVSTDNE